MHKEFRKAALSANWLDWIGQPLLYDTGLFINRTKEENECVDKDRYRIINVIKDTLKIMFTVSYDRAIERAAELSPTLYKPTEFIRWAEDIANILAYIYGNNYDVVTEDIVNAAKEVQDWEDE